MNLCAFCGTWWMGTHTCPNSATYATDTTGPLTLQPDLPTAVNHLSVLERVTRERDEARAELARHKAWWEAAEPVLKRANEQRESWSVIARAQARELTALRAAAQRVHDLRDDLADEPAHGWYEALDQLTDALAGIPTEADDHA